MELKKSDRGFYHFNKKLACGFTLLLNESSAMGEPKLYYGIREEAYCLTTKKPVQLPHAISSHYHLNNAIHLGGVAVLLLVKNLENGNGRVRDSHGTTFKITKDDGLTTITLENPRLQYFDGTSGDGWTDIGSLKDMYIATTWTLTDTEVKEHCKALRHFISNSTLS